VEEVKKYRLVYSLLAKDIARKLFPAVKPIIKSEIERLLENPYIGKELIEDLSGFRSLIIGKYRVIYRLDEETTTIQIHFIGHRRDVYMRFKELLLSTVK
jgi:mRNA interferase RelE/StbE